MSDSKINEEEFLFVNQILKNKKVVDESYKFNAYFKLYTEFIENFIYKTKERDDKSLKILLECMIQQGLPEETIKNIILNYQSRLQEECSLKI